MNLLLQKISLPLAPFVLEVDVAVQNRAVAVFGPSGAGKTSLLDVVAGLRRAKSAFIQLDGRVLTDTSRGVRVPARHRAIGYVPQDLALFPHLSVRQNLLYGHKPRRDSVPGAPASGPAQSATAPPEAGPEAGAPGGVLESDRGDFTSLFLSFEHVIEVLEIQPLIQRGVTDLSGGEKQRVALARALLTSPRLLLLDEPLAGLDNALKARILPYLARVRDEFKLPMLYVTHNPKEVAALCDEVLVMSQGRIIRRSPATDSTWSQEVEI